MIEEIKEDNNCIVKAFENNPIAILQENNNDDNKKIFYFKASDIGKVLNIVNIRTSIQNFDDDEKVVRTTYSSQGGNQECIFLTSQGVYRLLYNSKKEIAKKFRKWAGNILDDIIFNESKELKLKLEENEKKVKELTNKVENNDMQNKIDKHKFLIEKFKYKKCVYLGIIMYKNMVFIKIGSTANILERSNKHKSTYGNFLLLNVFESEYYLDLEKNILSDAIVRQHLYKEEINNYFSKECVKVSETFNYEQLNQIVEKYKNVMSNFTIADILEQQRINLEKQKLEYEMINNLLNHGEDFKNIIQNKLEDLHFGAIIEKKTEIIQRELNPDETNIENHVNLNLCATVTKRKPKGQKVQKIDPDNFQVFTVYPSMVYALRAPENNGFNKSGIQTAIKDNRIYKGFRWNFVKENEDQNIVNIQPTNQYTSKSPIIDTILELNNDKTEIINSFYTKDFLAKHLGLGKQKTKKIIENKELYNNHYYIEISKCPKELLDNYDKEINRIIPTHSKQIKQIHPITKQVVLFNSLLEISMKLGFSSKPILNAIKNKTIYSGSFWETL